MDHYLSSYRDILLTNCHEIALHSYAHTHVSVFTSHDSKQNYQHNTHRCTGYQSSYLIHYLRHYFERHTIGTRTNDEQTRRKARRRRRQPGLRRKKSPLRMGSSVRSMETVLERAQDTARKLQYQRYPPSMGECTTKEIFSIECPPD